MLNVLLYYGVSLFFIWFIQSQKIFNYVFITEFLKELRKCQICLGFWVCLFNYFIFQVGILDTISANWFIQIVNPIFTAAISSFIIMLLREGWKMKYGVYTVGG